MQVILGVNLVGFAEYFGLLVLAAALFMSILHFAGRVLYWLGPLGMIVGGIIIIFLAFLPNSAAGGNNGFIVAISFLGLIWVVWIFRTAAARGRERSRGPDKPES